MRIEHWSEGQSWSCLPHAVACFAATFWIQAHHGLLWSLIPLVLGLAFMVCQSGFVWDARSNKGRSYTGWVIRNNFIGWGQWKRVPEGAPVQLERTRASMMNRRGAPKAVKIDSWELQWQDAAGHWHALHDFTDRHMAHRALETVRQSLQP